MSDPGLRTTPYERDKGIERQRYESRAELMLATGRWREATGAQSVRQALRGPYVAYEAELSRYLHSGATVLELGAGTGVHTGALLAAGAKVVATDISEKSLDVLARSVSAPPGMLRTQVADMENLALPGRSFDFVACAGSLSYGDPVRVADEVLRVLKPGGRFVCVDSLNDNPIYRLNRWIHYLRGERSLSTLRRMPSLRTLEIYRARFAEVQVRYFGALTFLVPLLGKALGESRTGRILDAFDERAGTERSAFKFVMVATKG